MINLERRKEIPASLLRQNPSYRAADILQAFDEDFHSKCYLTEYKAPANSHFFEVDHFISQSEAPELAYEWTNLFPIYESANKIKPKKTPEGGYLNPCYDDVESEIIYSYSSITSEITFKAKNPINTKSKNTVILLMTLHNGRENEDSKMKAKNLQALINEKSIQVSELITNWKRDKSNEAINRKLKEMLSRKSAFTMLLRSMSIVRNNIPQSMLD
ncbi:MAG: hypothetical protein ACKVOU_11930 [Cytophagales bacterium]